MNRFIVLMLIFCLFCLKTTTNKGFSRAHRCQDKSLKKAIVEGNSKCLPKKIYSQMKELNLLHLTTLSGLHLSSLIKYSKLLLSKELILLSLIFGFLLEGYFSFKRMIILRWLRAIFQKLGYFPLFIFVCYIDVINGQFTSSPLSLIFSAAFIGTLLTSKAKNNLQLCIDMLLAQIILSYTLGQKVLLLNFISNFILIPIFSLSFPFFYLPYFDLKAELAFETLITKLYTFCSILPAIEITSVIFALSLMLFLKIKKEFILLMLLLRPQLLQPMQTENYKKNIFKVISPIKTSKNKYIWKNHLR